MVFYLVFLAKKLSHLKMIIKLAERKGFEPSIPISQNTRFPSARLKPLGHLSWLLNQLSKISNAFLSVTSLT